MKTIHILIIAMMLLISSANAAKYYCPSSSDGISGIYDPDSSCERWNSDFWRKNGPDTYSECLTSNQALKTKYQQGKCSLIQENTHMIDGCKCTIQISPKYNIIHSYSCSGGDSCKSTSEAMDKLKKMYNK